MTQAFVINFDYRCPFARNANEHVLAALGAGADYDVRFDAFSLSQLHVGEGEADVWDDPEKRSQLLALATGVVVRDRMPKDFPQVHFELFAARHDFGEDVREPSVMRQALVRGGVNADAVFTELEAGWPFDIVRAEHEAAVRNYGIFGVPTFLANDHAAFVRILTRPQDNGPLAKTTIDQVLYLLNNHLELNEFKHTTIPR